MCPRSLSMMSLIDFRLFYCSISLSNFPTFVHSDFGLLTQQGTMGNTNTGMGTGHRRDSRAKEGDRPKILMDSPEDADMFHGEDIKAPLEKEEYLAWRQDLEADKGPTLDRPTVFRWTGSGKEVFLSGSFNNWANKIPLTRRWVSSHEKGIILITLSLTCLWCNSHSYTLNVRNIRNTCSFHDID
ncbi:unnamed protein product [Oncorhynchus mykiss]|uniref:AMP-activated protein kinase glycogen-binding domain-containing protein n=1 Tax=Oncorhynchus mykiss TaxID=8022 RepID=A0A060Z9N9_ONCMY|nr:unnamed protein product [Oncorhynchus mykiss]